MKLKFVTPADVMLNRRTEESIRFNHTGLISLSSAASSKLDLKPNDSISFIFDEDSKRYYIGKTLKGGAGFVLLSYKEGNVSYQLKFNATRLVKKIFNDLELPPLKPKSNISKLFKLDIHNPVIHFNMTLYRMI
jgi:hypothetical protein